MKIALFKHTVHGDIVPWDDTFRNSGGRYVRISEWVDVQFPMLPDDVTTNAADAVKAKRLSELYAEIAALKGE